MNIRPANRRRSRVRGLSIVELTLAMVLAMGIAATAVIAIHQHATFIRILNQFNFLRDEAPTINTLLGRIILRADAYRIFVDKSAATSGNGAVTSGGSAVWLRFRNPDGSFRQSIIAFESNGGGGGGSGAEGLNFYSHDGTAWGGTPDWKISALPANVSFANNSGVLLITMTGPNSERVTYVGNSE